MPTAIKSFSIPYYRGQSLIKPNYATVVGPAMAKLSNESLEIQTTCYALRCYRLFKWASEVNQSITESFEQCKDIIFEGRDDNSDAYANNQNTYNTPELSLAHRENCIRITTEIVSYIDMAMQMLRDSGKSGMAMYKAIHIAHFALPEEIRHYNYPLTQEKYASAIRYISNVVGSYIADTFLSSKGEPWMSTQELYLRRNTEVLMQRYKIKYHEQRGRNKLEEIILSSKMGSKRLVNPEISERREKEDRVVQAIFNLVERLVDSLITFPDGKGAQYRHYLLSKYGPRSGGTETLVDISDLSFYTKRQSSKMNYDSLSALSLLLWGCFGIEF